MLHASTRSLGRTIAALTVVCLGLIAAPASATGGGGDPVPCEPKDAWTETVIITPAVPAVPDVPAVPAVTEERFTDPGQPYVAPTEGRPAAWWNFAQRPQGPFIYAPPFPRTTWHVASGRTQRWPHAGTYPSAPSDRGGNSRSSPRARHRGRPGQPYVAPTYETVVVTPAFPRSPAPRRSPP